MNDRLKISIRFLFLFCLISIIPVSGGITFTGTELLGRPTDHSITLNVVADAGMEAYVEYGTVPGVYTNKTMVVTAGAGEPLEIEIDKLSSDSRYYYRLRYRERGTAGDFLARPEYRFHTQRAETETFVFTIISDSHLGWKMFNTPTLYEIASRNVNKDHPDLHFDLGDAFTLTRIKTGDMGSVRREYLAQRPYMGLFGHSAPLFLVIGNHEEEEAWNLDDAGDRVGDSKPVMSVDARKRFFLNPIPDGFYSGNTDNSQKEIDGDHLKEDYYAFEWGCALFVVLDPYWYTTVKPFIGTIGGEGADDDTPPPDRWRWTLGKDQYDWLKRTLEQSKAKYKFVLAHQVAGGGGRDADYGRGGEKATHGYEWGAGPEEFAAHRPAWSSAKSIHRLLIDNGVDIFFHGHDHIYAREEVDGMVYQECPFPAYAGKIPGFGTYTDDPPGTIVKPNSGHLRVTVSPEKVTVDYVRAFLPGEGPNGHIEYSYSITKKDSSSVAAKKLEEGAH